MAFTIPVSGEEANAWPPQDLVLLEIQVTSTEDGGTTPPPPHTWHAPVVEDMLQGGKSGLTEVVVMGPGQAILFYGRWSLGEGFSLCEAWDAMIMLSGAISWVGRQAQLNASVISPWECWHMIAQAIVEWHIKARGPGHPHSHLPALPPFSFCNQDRPQQEGRLQSMDECGEEPRHTH